jgi:hypothetical protein
MADSASEARDRLGARAGLPLLAVILAVAAWLSFNPALFNDGDTSWHLATGRWMLENRTIPAADPFSFTFRGRPWTAHEWLIDSVMAAAFRRGGWGALALVFSFSVAVTLLIVGRELLRWLAPRHALLTTVLLTAVLAPFMLARPHVVTWPLLAAWTMVLIRAREQGRAPAPYWALLILLWANLHASFIFALLLAGFFALEALIDAKRNRLEVLVRWAVFGVLALAAALATPHGIDGLLYPLQVSGMKALPLIAEWRATRFSDDWLFILFAAAALTAAVLRSRAMGPLRLLLLVALAALAMLHVRHQPLFAIVAVLLLAPALGSRRQEPGNRRLAATAIAVSLVLLGVARLLVPTERGDARTYPATALAKLPPELRRQPVFNDYSFGGPLILNGIAPYIDGRADMYGDSFTIAHDRMVRGDRAAFADAQRRWRFGWTILAPNAPLVRVLDRQPEWRRFYADRWAVVHVRRAATGPKFAG